jgi:precorrin-6B methylase 2
LAYGARARSQDSSQATGHVRPETAVLLDILRPTLERPAADDSSTNLDWEDVLRLARWHGVLELLHHYLDQRGTAPVPLGLLRHLRDHAERLKVQAGSLVAELLSLIETFDARGIRVVSLMSLEPHNVARQPMDLRLLVPRSAVWDTGDLLVARGYRPTTDLTRGQRSALLRCGSAIGFIRSADRQFVTLNWDLAPRHLGLSLDLMGLWRRIRLIPYSGRDVPVLSPEDYLLALSIRAAAQGWERFLWLVEMRDFVQSHHNIDWNLAADIARKAGAERILLVALELAREPLGAALPREIRERLAADQPVQMLAARLRPHLASGPPARIATGERLRLSFAAKERIRDRLRLCLRWIATPTLADLRVVSLPSAFCSLYYALRLIRLAAAVLASISPKRSASGLLARFRPTAPEVIQRMLLLADIRPRDVVYDLGCGDGRIVISAAKRCGASGVGVELDPSLVRRAASNARKAGVSHLVTFLQADARRVDLSEATVVTLYLQAQANLALRPRLQEELREGTRIVSLNFDMGDWLSDAVDLVEDEDGLINTLFLWRVSGTSNGRQSEHFFQTRERHVPES